MNLLQVYSSVTTNETGPSSLVLQPLEGHSRYQASCHRPGLLERASFPHKPYETNSLSQSGNNYTGLHTSKACGKNYTSAVSLEFESIVLLYFAQSIKPLHVSLRAV